MNDEQAPPPEPTRAEKSAAWQWLREYALGTKPGARHAYVAFREWTGLKERESAKPEAAANDTARIDFIAQQLLEEAMGYELFPVGADVEYAEDDNTIAKINYWQWLNHEGATFREAIDAAMTARIPQNIDPIV